MDRVGRYVLVDGVQVPEPNLMKWAQWMEEVRRTSEWIVAKTKIDKNISVSTVFLGLDHNYDLEGPPLVFETMIFGGPKDECCWRYATKAEALEGHGKAVIEAKQQALGPRDWSPRTGKCFCKGRHHAKS